MNPHFVVSLNCDAFSRGGPWGIAIQNWSGDYTQLLAPVFKQRFDAEVFAAWLPASGIDGTPEAELAAARECSAFVAAWDDKHADDDRYPTPDGKYASPVLMARWFAESKATVPA